MSRRNRLKPSTTIGSRCRGSAVTFRLQVTIARPMLRRHFRLRVCSRVVSPDSIPLMLCMTNSSEFTEKPCIVRVGTSTSTKTRPGAGRMKFLIAFGLRNPSVLPVVMSCGLVLSCGSLPPDFHLPTDRSAQPATECRIATVERVRTLHWLSSASMDRADTRAVCRLDPGELLWIDFNRSVARSPPSGTVAVLFDAAGDVTGYRTDCDAWDPASDGLVAPAEAATTGNDGAVVR